MSNEPCYDECGCFTEYADYIYTVGTEIHNDKSVHGKNNCSRPAVSSRGHLFVNISSNTKFNMACFAIAN